ncbi:hypothetical protein QMO56_13260 [Roseomonas sp. E05]|uniref:hypothetical protein n=1 Tax=Roseomonas sp. E05 TaxID=3046310 RepID=UPI0024BBAA1B|nr:hypothetical protein [Roseomonas sp. E05]MDJ0389086.1 hypothetical protein [Roseomonas sp. E05]
MPQGAGGFFFAQNSFSEVIAQKPEENNIFNMAHLPCSSRKTLIQQKPFSLSIFCTRQPFRQPRSRKVLFF